MRVPLLGYGASALIPIIAAFTYAALQGRDIRLESSAIHILWAGPVSIILLVSSGLHIWRHRAQN